MKHAGDTIPSPRESVAVRLPPPLDDPDLLDRAGRGDLDALAVFDDAGLILGAAEDLEAWTRRMKALRNNLAKLESDLAENGVFEIEGMRFPRESRIDADLFAPAHDLTESLYRFQARWTPGFYVNPRFGWLFGGCAYWFQPDFLALFIVRRAFANREKWLFYRRTELLAHELCHVARAGFDDPRYEEMHAYGTSDSGFRRRFGSMFRSPWDSYGLLGTVFLLLIAQVLRFSLMMYAMPVWPFWLLVVGAILFFVLRQLRDLRDWNRALRNLATVSGSAGNARPMLFRCSDAEIAALAALRSPQEVREWIEYRRRTDLRWQVIGKRFLDAS